MLTVQLFCLITIFKYIETGTFDSFAQNKYRVRFDRGVVVYQNPEYFSDVQLKNVMINRKDRGFSVHFCVKQRLYGDNFKLNIKCHKLLYNVPADLLLQFDVKICDMLNNNVFGAKDSLKKGNATTCPIEKGCYDQNNFSLDDTKFPPLIPPGAYRLDLTYFFGKTKVFEVQLTIDVKYGTFM